MKRFLKIAAVFLLIVYFCPAISVFAGGREAKQVFAESSAVSHLLMDGDSGEVLSQKNADHRLPMASTTKLMTCILALDRASLSDLVKIPKEAVGVEGSSVYLVEGEALSLEELLYALMLESANDAAVSIAMHVAGSVEAFAEQMNQKAKEIGMASTAFVNPHGLPAEGHYSTARDLCTLMTYCMNNAAFRVFAQTQTTTISAPQSGKRFLSNHNRLLRSYDACVGGKTGFTKEAGRCLVTAAERNGKRLICATLSAPDDWNDHVSLFEYGFSLYDERVLAAPSTISASLSVVGGKEAKLTVSNVDGLSKLVRKNQKVDCHYELPPFVYAGIGKGEQIGFAVFTVEGEEVGRVPLLSEKAVSQREEKLSFWKKIIQCIRLWIS